MADFDDVENINSPVIDDNHVIDEYVGNTDNCIEKYIIDDTFPQNVLFLRGLS